MIEIKCNQNAIYWIKCLTDSTFVFCSCQSKGFRKSGPFVRRPPVPRRKQDHVAGHHRIHERNSSSVRRDVVAMQMDEQERDVRRNVQSNADRGRDVFHVQHAGEGRSAVGPSVSIFKRETAPQGKNSFF